MIIFCCMALINTRSNYFDMQILTFILKPFALIHTIRQNSGLFKYG